jgi:peptidoglycan/xylan/chitin deacetylase (PgdA/CDA1 family)
MMTTNKIAYLTIDDAPSSTMNEKVDYLWRKEIPAVWFCRGDFLEQRPDPGIYAIRKGFVLGNHAYNHPYFSDLTIVDEGLKQIRRTDEIIEALYKRAGVKRPAKYFRFPFGDKGDQKHAEDSGSDLEAGRKRKQALQAYLRQLGYTQPHWEHVTYDYYQANGLQDDVDWYWTYDVMEWSIFANDPQRTVDSLEKVFARMEEDEPENGLGLNSATSAEIILAHDHAETTAYFEPIIERLLEKGLTFMQPIW